MKHVEAELRRAGYATRKTLVQEGADSVKWAVPVRRNSVTEWGWELYKFSHRRDGVHVFEFAEQSDNIPRGEP